MLLLTDLISGIFLRFIVSKLAQTDEASWVFCSQVLTIAALWPVFSGYNFQCDIKQLACSYEELKCFKNYELLLDIRNIYKEPRGGLAGLAEVLYK